MAFIEDGDRKEIQRILSRMENPVRLIHFTQKIDCEACDDTHSLLQELAAASDNISLEVLNFAIDKERAAEYGIDKVPATVIDGGNGHRIRFYGIPSGYEFVSLLDAVVLVSRGDSELDPASRSMIAAIQRPLHLEVLVTPACPYCPRAVRLAYQMALENPNITADAIEISEYPDLAQEYRVMGVPKTMINGRIGVDGALPEGAFVTTVVLSTTGVS